MKRIIIIFLSFIVYSVSAQVSFKTGSVQLDSDLNTINVNALADFGAFKSDLSVTYNVLEKKIEYMKVNLKMAPGEIYLALEISKLSKTQLDKVLTTYEENKSKGWGYIAKEVGIKPGSSEFHQLKNNASSKKNKGQGKQKSSKGKAKGKGKDK